MTTETQVSSTGAVSQHTAGPSGTPHTQAEADAIMATWSQPRNPPGTITAAPMPGAGLHNSDFGGTPEQLATLAQWRAEDASPAGRIKALQKDPTFREKLLNRDPAATRVWEQLHQAAAQNDPVIVGAASPEEAASMAEDAAGGLPINDADHATLAKSYEMPKLGDSYGPEQQKLDTFARGVLASIGASRGEGSYILAEIGRNADVVNAMTESARADHEKKQAAMLRDLWKGNHKQNAKDTLAFLDRLNADHPGLWGWLDRAGGLTASVAVQLHNRLVAMREGVTQHRQSKGK